MAASPKQLFTRKRIITLAVLAALPALAHATVGLTTRISAPPIAAASGEPASADTGDLRVLDKAYVRQRGSILEVRLAGSPETIGHQHSRLLYRDMVANETQLYEQFERFVPFAPARWAIVDLGRVRFRHVDQGMSGERRREIASQARAFSPDPFDGFLPTYHRFVFLQSLYDIALSFEHSPLIGCTSFALTGEASAGGHTLLARNFDFEAGPIFDERKAVFLMREEGRIPYASVAWPGLVGVVSGVNLEGVAVVVHGGRAREPRNVGEPVVHTLRDVLGIARTTAEAIALLRQRSAMASHIIMIADARGDVAIVERAPGEEPFVRRSAGKVPLTNHFESPLAADPANRAVEEKTSTWPRRRRLDELLSNLPAGATVKDAVAILRDRSGTAGSALPLGDRRAIDALIATHAVVIDATDRTLWVSEGPHLVGRFVRFDLKQLLAQEYEPKADEELTTLPEDAIASDGRYEAWRQSGEPHPGGAK